MELLNEFNEPIQQSEQTHAHTKANTLLLNTGAQKRYLYLDQDLDCRFLR